MPGSKHFQIAAVAALAALVLGLAASFYWGLHGSGRQPLYATVLPEPLPLPAFSLQDQRAARFTRENLRGQTSLLFFGFTHCPDICPATLQQLALARKQIAEASPARGGSLPQIILISVDPERDTPEKLAQYVSHFGEGVTAATGSPEAIQELSSALGVFFVREAMGEDDYTVSHSTAVLVIDEEVALQALFSAPHKTEYFVHDLPLLMAAR